MTELNTREMERKVEPGLDRNLERLDQDLDIMERHEAELAEAESDVQESMKKWDREYKDSRLHSIPKPRKHIR